MQLGVAHLESLQPSATKLLQCAHADGCPPCCAAPEDIQRVKAELEKQKDLEGIDVSNIVTDSRRRRTAAAPVGAATQPAAAAHPAKAPGAHCHVRYIVLI